MEEKLGKEEQESGKAQKAVLQELQSAQACIQELEARLKEAKASTDSRLLRAKADAEHDRERQASRAGDLEARIAEIEAQWEIERAKANLQVHAAKRSVLFQDLCRSAFPRELCFDKM